MIEEINLDMENNNHKNINLTPSNSNNTNGINTNGINIVKNEMSNISSGNIGLDLLVNKSKTSDSIDEFKSLVSPIKDSVDNNINITLNDIGSSSTSITPKPDTNNINSSINLTEEKTDNGLNELDLNLDDLFNENKNNDSSQNVDLNSRDPTPIPSTLEPQQKQKTYEELQNEKAEFIRLLERLEKRGIHSHKKFNMNSNYEEVKSEYERLNRQKECDQSIKFQRKMLVAFVTAIEFLNGRFDPFDVKLDGWSESVHENSGDYDDIFEELHDKYKSKANMAPELRLLLMLGGSGFMFHLTNTMFKTSLPGMNDIMSQNPDLMNQFAKATAASMGEKQPGFSNLMGSLFNQTSQASQPPPQPKREMSGPPNINNLLNNMNNNNKMDIDMHSNYSESDMEQARNINTRSQKSVNLDI
jgi:hypothetical protein